MEKPTLNACIRGSAAPCACGCPFQFDVREFLTKLQRGSFGAAFNLYRNAVLFPDLVHRICPAPCQNACGRVLGEEPLQLRQLEKAAVAFSRSREPVNYGSARKGKKVVVLGASLEGLSCALKLGNKGYDVAVLEQGDRIAPELDKLLPREVFEPEIMGQFRYTGCQFQFEAAVEDACQMQWDALFVSQNISLDVTGENVFGVFGMSGLLERMARGMTIADEMEWFLQTGNQRPPQPAQEEPTCVPSEEAPAGKVMPSGETYTKAEARQEAMRCTMCDCSACMQECVLLRQYGAAPNILQKDVLLSLNLFEETQGRAAMREMGACNNCGLCKKLCPTGVDIGNFLLHSRSELYALGHLPPAHHEFWIRDMEFSNSQDAALQVLPEGSTCKRLYFPGCQLGASDSRYVTLTYRKLLEQEPNTGLFLGCCGIPLLWAGRAADFLAACERLKQKWEEMGKPTVLLACPSCCRNFKTYLLDIPVEMVFEYLEPQGAAGLTEAAVFDPCASREYPQMQSAVRRAAEKTGVCLSELRHSGELATCCSWGGQAHKVHPLFVNTLAKENIAQSDLPYITYCTNCRDVFAGRGKECRHILDLLLDINQEQRQAPNVSQRRRNRIRLKRELIQTYALDIPEPEEKTMLKLYMEGAILRKMNEELILEEDVSNVIDYCQKTHRYLVDQENGHLIGHLQQGYLTFWVEYSAYREGYLVHNVYTHRMTIREEYGEGDKA